MSSVLTNCPQDVLNITANQHVRIYSQHSHSPVIVSGRVIWHLQRKCKDVRRAVVYLVSVILVLPAWLKWEVATLQNALGKFKVEAHTAPLSAGVVLSSSLPAASKGWQSRKYFQQCSGQQSTPSNLWQMIWLGVEPINTPCWQAGAFQLFDCHSDRWSAWVCKKMILLLLINTYSESCWGTLREVPLLTLVFIPPLPCKKMTFRRPYHSTQLI